MKLVPTGVCAAMAAVLISAAPAQGQVKKQEIIQEIQKAFDTWQQVSCSKLSFEYAGEVTSFVSEKEGGILVYFGHDSATWSHEQLAYFVNSDFHLVEQGDLYRATIALNARDWFWSIGKEAQKIDIQTAVLHMIPGAIGFYVGAAPTTGSLKAFIGFDQVNHTLDPLHVTGAQFTYFEAGASCTQPAQPVICGMTAPPADAGAADLAAADAAVADATTADAAVADAAAADAAPAADLALADTGAAVDAGPPLQLCIHHSSPNDPSQGKPLHWTDQPIKYWIYVPDRGKLPGSLDTEEGDGGTTGDGSTVIGDGGPPKACNSDNDCPPGQLCSADKVCVSGAVSPGDDDGCCRVAHNRGENLGGTLLLVFGLGLLALVARRRS